MENFGGRSCLTDHRATIGSNYVANRALEKQERWLDKVAYDSKKGFSREEWKIKQSFHRLQAEKIKCSLSNKESQDSSPVPCYISHSFERRSSYQRPSNAQYGDEGSEHHHHHHHHYHDVPNKHVLDHRLDGLAIYQDTREDHNYDKYDHYQHNIREDPHMKGYGKMDRHVRVGRHSSPDGLNRTRNYHDGRQNTVEIHSRNQHPRNEDYNSHDERDHHTMKDDRFHHHSVDEHHNPKDAHRVKFSDGKKTHRPLSQISSTNGAIPPTSQVVENTDSTSRVNNLTSPRRGKVSSLESFNSGSSLSRIPKYTPSASIRSSYDEAIKKLSVTDISQHLENISHKPSTDSFQAEVKHNRARIDKLAHIDSEAFQELEEIIKEAKIHTINRKESSTSSINVGTRHQKRRLQHLEELLDELRPRVIRNIPFDPISILECRYLRLSRNNVEHLENVIRQSGIDPGIHAHSNVIDYDFWK